MKVYRYVSQDELNLMLKEDNQNLGNFFRRKFFNRPNDHKYKKGEKYLHFFENLDDLFLIQVEYKNVPQNFYICEFDIPSNLLLKGHGYYLNPHGYDDHPIKVKEYILPSKKFSCLWLKQYNLDKLHSPTKTELII